MNIIIEFQKALYYCFNVFRFKRLGYGSYFRQPLELTKEFIFCGKNVISYYRGIRLQGVKRKGIPPPKIIIGDNVSFQQNLHLTCGNMITIGQNTAIAANVTITDIHHPFDNINMPIEQQPIHVSQVQIGADCKIYNNAVILPGITIGKHVTIGANSVVNINIPDYCVAVGAPAKIIKRYNFETEKWERTQPDGTFISEIK